MGGTRDGADATPADTGTHTDQGAPKDKVHEDAGDGSLTGSTPAGLTVDELLEQANSDKTDDGGAG